MKIKFWGTAAGLAEKNRYCTSVLIETGGGYYILDFGAPVEYLIANENIDRAKIRAGFITHMHSDHAETLVSFAKLYASFTDFLYAPSSVEVYMPSGTAEFRNWLAALNLDMSERFKTVEIKEGLFYDTEFLKVSAIRTEHLGKNKPSYAFVFEADGKKVLFTGDLTEDFRDFPFVEGCDAIVCELAHGEMTSVAEHLQASGCKRVVFYHMSEDAYIVEKIKVDRIGIIKSLKEKLDFDFEIAYDGFETEI